MSPSVLIPDPDVVRIELARSVRESQRLRELLRVAYRAKRDREFIEGAGGGAVVVPAPKLNPCWEAMASR